MSAAQIKALARVTMAQFAILADEAISADPSLRGEKLSAALMAKLDEPAPTTTIDEKPTKIIDEATSDTTTVAASFGAASSYTLVESTSTNFRKFKFQLPYFARPRVIRRMSDVEASRWIVGAVWHNLSERFTRRQM